MATVAATQISRAQTPPPLGYNIKTVSLTGPGYEHTDGLGLHRSAHFASGSGNIGSLVAGQSSRYSSSGGSLGADAWLFDGNTSTVVGLVGPGYEYSAPGGTYRFNSPAAYNLAGHVVGRAQRLTATGASIGYDAFVFNGSTTQAIGLTGSAYQYTSPNGVFYESFADGMSTSNAVLGNNNRFAANGDSLGHDYWYYTSGTPQLINPTGGVYEYNTAGGAYRLPFVGNNYTPVMTPSGKVLGQSPRYSASGGDLGVDNWVFDGSTTTIVGLTGGVYEYTDADGTHRSSNADSTVMNDSGKAAGLSYRYTAAGGDLGESAWYYHGTSTQQIGFTGGVYEYSAPGGTYHDSSIWTTQMSSAGHVAGVSVRFASDGSDLGGDAWIYNGSTLTQVGLLGNGYDYGAPGGTYRFSSANTVNAAGHAIGSASRYASDGTDLGNDAYIYDGSQSTRINLTGAGYEYSVTGGVHRDGEAYLLTPGGRAAGGSSRYASNGTPLGIDSFVYDGSTTHRVNLTGGVYDKNTPNGIERLSFVRYVNDVDDAAVGASMRFAADGSNLGQAGYYFDLADDTGFALEFSIRSDGYSWTNPQWLTDEGVVLGSYDLFSGSDNLGRHMFWWSDDDGFHDLGALVNGGLSANGFDALNFIAFAEGAGPGGSPMTITGNGLGINQYPVNHTLFQLQAQIPEPASIALLAPALMALRRRRRIG